MDNLRTLIVQETIEQVGKFENFIFFEDCVHFWKVVDDFGRHISNREVPG